MCDVKCEMSNSPSGVILEGVKRLTESKKKIF